MLSQIPYQYAAYSNHKLLNENYGMQLSPHMSTNNGSMMVVILLLTFSQLKTG
jgi:hypothetical protein